tara:strand:+ start:2998 stop:3729 length:732 start_codon:yes stop_codon:yes gene_type:complete
MGASQSAPPKGSNEKHRSELVSASAQVQRAANEIERLRRSEARYKEVAGQALAEAHGLRKEGEKLQQQQMMLFGSLAVMGVGAAAAVAAAVMARRSQRSAIEAASLTLAEVRQRAAQTEVKAERFGAEPLARSLVPVCDNVDMLLSAADGASDGAKGVLEGAQLTAKSLFSALEGHSIRRVSPELGSAFDPSVMEAMYTVPSEPPAEADVVASVLRPGYLLHDRVLRAAQVGVTVHAPKETSE